MKSRRKKTKPVAMGAARELRSSAKSEAVQYTIRGISAEVDARLREQARQQGISLNELAVRTLRKEAGFMQGFRHTDMDWFFGSWVEDPEFDKAMREMEVEQWAEIGLPAPPERKK